jgi:predicted MFS family arabinose efflux permease
MPLERGANPPLQNEQSVSAPLPRVLWPLLFGNFVIGTGVMVVPGTLNDISSNLQVSVPVAGQLITAAAVVMCLGAPLCATLVAGRDRRRLLALALLSALFLGAGVWVARLARRRLSNPGGSAVDASLGELARDRESLRGRE